MTASDRHGPSLGIAIAVGAIVSFGDFATSFVFSLSCAISENGDQIWLHFCETPLVWLPALAAFLVVLSAVVSRSRRRSGPLVLGAALGTALAIAPWVLMGDPAGNFPGLLRS